MPEATNRRAYEQVVREKKHLDTPPVWLMRQAGRYLPEYNAIRANHSFLEVCHTPDLAAEVTLQPIRRFGFDASILFSDILVPLQPMGAELTFGKGHGPRIANTIRTAADLEQMKDIEPREALSEVLETVTILRRELPETVSLIGFAGAPFTLATYWIEGGKPDPFANVKRMQYAEPDAFRSLLDRLADMVSDYLIAQVEAGADAVQLFDTWAGILPDREFRQMILPSLQRILSRLREEDIPCTYFVRGSGHLVRSLGETGSDVVSLDWRTPLDEARDILPEGKVIQGNLDPTILLSGDESVIRRETRRVLNEAGDAPHIFNLGHGILPQTPIEAVEILLDEIRGGAR
ncbi:uroporphyrinogen decarboxylase [bacterium]|nr:uroporphyrinogen decarboxylase [bacterium]